MTRRSPIIAGVVGVAALALVVLFVISPKGDAKQDTSPLLGKLAPQLTGTTSMGESIDLDSYRGEWVLVNFFATWCPPCVLEHPELVQLSKDDGGDLQVISVVSGDSASNVEKFFADNGGNWPVLVDDTGASGLDYGLKKLPESYLIAPDGTVVTKFAGGIVAEDRGDQQGIQSLIAALSTGTTRS